MSGDNPLWRRKVPRRQFLSLCTLGAIPVWLAACQSEPHPVGKAETATPRPAPLGTADWAVLAGSLQGTLVRPGSPDYATARQLFDPQFDSVLPAGIAYCGTPSDIRTCLAFAERFGVDVAARSGGHSYGGYSTSTGLVLDVSRMNAVSVDAGAQTATVGAGARLIDVYSALARAGLALPAGSCPTVGVAGLTLGGGVGVLGRKFGLTCDSLLSAQVCAADGRMLTCSNDQESDLFWALRGGGGGNFGVVTSLTFRAYPIEALSIFTLDWAWDRAAGVVDAWQRWAPGAPDELWSNCLLLASAGTEASPLIRVNGVYVGEITSLQPLLYQLTKQIGADPSSRYIAPAGVLDTMLIEANCAGLSVAACHLPSQNPAGQLTRETFGAKSDYFDTLMPASAIEKLLSAIAERQGSSELGAGFITLDASGGAINRVDPAATAFVHRNALFSAQYYATWAAGDSAAVVAANHGWLTDTWQAMRPYVSGSAYQNYIDPDLAGWQIAYYGSNWPRLQRIKAAYDPSDVFHFAQSITAESN